MNIFMGAIASSSRFIEYQLIMLASGPSPVQRIANLGKAIFSALEFRPLFIIGYCTALGSIGWLFYHYIWRASRISSPSDT